MDQYIGKMLDDRYEILERIGTGGMAVVYKAKCHRLNRLVAVKILKSDLAQDADFRRRFHAESKAVAMLSHPNIVSVYDVSQSGETEYIVMELIDGITLKQYIEKRGQLNWRESLHFMTQIMKGLSHAHSRGIVHRDIKPQNIMVLRDGSVKVADFGIACLENSAQTLTQEALGSVHYISPEQARGDRTDARSDIYSAGVMFYEMLSGRLPFEGDSAVAVAIQHLSSIPLPPREINPDIPPALELIDMRAMAPDISKRYPTADAMVADLETFRKNPDVDLDYSITDLQDSEPDEPTRHIPTAAVNNRQAPPERESRRYPDMEPSRGGRSERDYDREYDRRGGVDKKRVAIIAGGCVAAVLLIFLLFRFVQGTLQPPEVPTYVVPNLVGMTLEEAKEDTLIADGTFKLLDVKYEASAAPEGEIIKQSPEGQSSTKTELEIQVWISSGMDTSMPDVKGKDVRVAEQMLRDMDLNLTIEKAEADSEDVELGFVIKSDPVDGVKLKEGDKVTLTVSTGKKEEMVTVPSFLDTSIEKAQEWAESLGLVVSNVWENALSNKPAGTVVDQDLVSGASVPKGTKISLTVSTNKSSGAATQTDVLTILLPAPMEGQMIARMTVKQGSSIIVDMDVDLSLSNYALEVSNTGNPNFDVYFDGNFDRTYTAEFDNG